MNDLRAAGRSLLATPGATVIIVATLAIAIGANTAIFSVVDGVLLRPLGYGDDGRLMAVWATTGPGGADTFRLSPADYRDLRDAADAFAGEVALYRFIGSTLTELEPPVRVGSMTVTPRLFSVLETTAAAGRLFDDEDGTPGGGKKVVLTHSSWTRRFAADPELVGSAVELDGEPYVVVGVTEPGFSFPPGDREVELYFPMTLSDAILLDRDHRMFDSIARLREGTSVEAARAELGALADRLARDFPDTNEGWSLTVRPVRDELLGDLRPTLWMLWGAVFLVLLVACTNVSNLLIARSDTATRELAVRAAFGARPGDLCRRSLAESLLLGLAGGALGVLLAYWGVALLRALLPADIPRAAAISVDGDVLLVAVVLVTASIALFGTLPALRSMTPDLLASLKPSAASGALGGGRRLRELMVMLEVALAFVLVVGAGLMVRSFQRLSEVDPGFHQEGVTSVAVQLPRSRYGRAEWRPFFEQLVEWVGELPGVLAAGAVSDLPMSSVGLGFELEFDVAGLDSASPSARPNSDVRMVVPGYFEAMGMEVANGRSFDSLDPTRESWVAIVNQTLVERYFQGIDPIGRTLRLQSLGEVEIVGVVSDIRHRGLLSSYESEIYLPYGRLATSEMHVVAYSDSDSAQVARAIGGALAEIDPELAPSQTVALSDLLWESIARPRFNAALMGGLALCAGLLAALGTYGIVAYTVSQRSGELGVRMALGAGAGATISLVLRQALAIVLAGSFLGLLAALGTTRFLRQLLHEVEPTDPLVYGAVIAAAVLVGLVAAWVPARRATRVDPVTALRDG